MAGQVYRILVTGAGGQLGQELVHQQYDGVTIIGCDRDALDVTDIARCREVIGSVSPDAIIHAAAYTAVDRAEEEPDEAYRINAVGTANVALAAHEHGARLCYVSTDYVFDGEATQPYRVGAATNPQSVYGKSKRAGELLLQQLGYPYYLVRTSWVYGTYGHNFVKTMLRLGAERQSVTVVADQRGAPTYTADLARFLVGLVQTDAYGVYHASNTGECTWHELAQAIFEEEGMAVQVDPCTTAQMNRPAPRPRYSVMDHEALLSQGFSPLRPWREALRACLQELRAGDA